MKPKILKGRKIEYFEVNFHDLEDFINHCFFSGKKDKKKYNFSIDEEPKNDSSHTVEIDGDIDNYNQERFNKRESRYCMWTVYLNMACRLRLIPKGEYLIQSSW